MKYKRLGVLGGMGPKATAVFFDKVIENTRAQTDQEHIDMVILNHASLPDRTRVILNKQEELFLSAIEKDLKLLEYAQVAHIAIPCNTAHYFYDQLQAKTDIPIIHMVAETVQKLYSKYGAKSKIGILATNGTIQSGIYAQECAKYGMELHVPIQTLQNQIMNIIYENIKRDLPVDIGQLEAIIEELIDKEQCQGIIIACTELSCVQLGEKTASYCTDAMQVLVERAIHLSQEVH